MKLRTIVLFGVAVCVLGIACSPQPNSSNTNSSVTPAATGPGAADPVAETSAVFAKNCQGCHQPDGTGGPVKLDDGTRLRVPSLREGHSLRHPDSDFRKQIQKGGDGMPAFKDKLNPQQIEDLIRFIRKEFQGGAAPPPEKSPAKEKM